MKVLLVFIDMMRTDLLSVYNQNVKDKTSFDLLLEKIGGCIYTNCYTPAPDTPRSLACLQTGLHPYFNGCNTRIKWPKYYVKEEIDTIFDILSNNKILINYYAPKVDLDTGALSIKEGSVVNLFTNIEKFTSNILQSTCDEMDFLTLDDYHWAIDDYGATHKAVKIGHNIISNVLNTFFRTHSYDEFDHIFFFSDHGHKLENEIALMESALELLRDDRAKILMVHRSKRNSGLSIDNRLCSIQDLYATILSIFHLNYDHRDSLSLLSTSKSDVHDHLIIEDHADFTVSLNQVISVWRYISDAGSFYTNVCKYSKEGYCELSNSTIISLIKQKSPTYLDYERQMLILKEYSKMSEKYCTYSNGGKRLGRKKQVLLKVKNKCYRFLIKCFR